MQQTWTVRALADLFAVANHVFGLSVVHLLRPATLHMIHCFCGKYYSCSVHLDQDANWPQALSEQAADHLTVASTLLARPCGIAIFAEKHVFLCIMRSRT